jgi:hypothetical protein
LSFLLPWVLIIFIFYILLLALNTLFIYYFYLEVAVPELLKVLCEGNVRKNLEQHQALTKLLAEILDFSFEFDYLKVVVHIVF